MVKNKAKKGNKNKYKAGKFTFSNLQKYCKSQIEKDVCACVIA